MTDIPCIHLALRLNPIPPPQYLNYLAGTYFSLGQYEDAIEVDNELLKRSPNYLFAHIELAALYIASGREEEARQQAEELLRLDPSFSLDKWAEAILPFFEDKATAERYIDLLRKAGLK